MTIRAEGFPLVIAAPSGAGKTSLARALVGQNGDVAFSVSATTRPRREYERDGVDYHFVEPAEFDRMIEAGELVEWAEVHGKKYGTPWRSIREGIADGGIVILDIDVQGARQIRQAFEAAVLVFILPPSVAELERRLCGRGTESREVVEVRLRNALGELAAVGEFDYVVVNDDFESALSRLEAICAAERLRVARADGLSDELDRMSRDIENLLSKES